MLTPTTSNADLERKDMVRELYDYPNPMLCDLFDNTGKLLEKDIIIPWGMLEKIDESHDMLIFKKNGKEIRVGPGSGYICTLLMVKKTPAQGGG